MSFLLFNEAPVPKGIKTRIWNVRNTSQMLLGWVKFAPHWRRYVFIPDYAVQLQFDAGCLKDIVQFLEEQTQAWKDSL